MNEWETVGKPITVYKAKINDEQTVAVTVGGVGARTVFVDVKNGAVL